MYRFEQQRKMGWLSSAQRARFAQGPKSIQFPRLSIEFRPFALLANNRKRFRRRILGLGDFNMMLLSHAFCTIVYDDGNLKNRFGILSLSHSAGWNRMTVTVE